MALSNGRHLAFPFRIGSDGRQDRDEEDQDGQDHGPDDLGAAGAGEGGGQQDERGNQVQDPAEIDVELQVLAPREEPQADEEDLQDHARHECPCQDEECVPRATDH